MFHERRANLSGARSDLTAGVNSSGERRRRLKGRPRIDPAAPLQKRRRFKGAAGRAFTIKQLNQISGKMKPVLPSGSCSARRVSLCVGMRRLCRAQTAPHLAFTFARAPAFHRSQLKTRRILALWRHSQSYISSQTMKRRYFCSTKYRELQQSTLMISFQRLINDVKRSKR